MPQTRSQSSGHRAGHCRSQIIPPVQRQDRMPQQGITQKRRGQSSQTGQNRRATEVCSAVARPAGCGGGQHKAGRQIKYI